MAEFLSAYVREENAATMTEYALMLFLIGIACIASVALCGKNLVPLFARVAPAI